MTDRGTEIERVARSLARYEANKGGIWFDDEALNKKIDNTWRAFQGRAKAAISAMSSEDEVRRLREALTFYAAESNYKAGRTFMKRPLIPVMADGGETARTALTPNPCGQGDGGALVSGD